MAGRSNNDDVWGGMSVGWSIVAYLLSGILLGWGIGYGIDRLAGTPKVFTAIGMVGGVILSIYLVYLHYGKQDEQAR